jgi:hypothetical protein
VRLGDQLGVDLEAEHARLEPPVRVDLPRPGGALDLAGDEVARGHPGPGTGQRDQPVGVPFGRLLRHDQVVRHPGLAEHPAAAAGQHRVDPGGRQRLPYLLAAPLQLGQRVREGRDGTDPVRGDLGQVLAQLAAEADQRDPHVVGPAVGGQLQGQCRQDRTPGVRRAAQRDQPVRRLQVDQDAAARPAR